MSSSPHRETINKRKFSYSMSGQLSSDSRGASHMNRISLIAFVAVALLIGCARVAHSQDTKPPLRLVQTISLPSVKGRLDHMDVDVSGKRLFVAGLEHGTFEVADLQPRHWVPPLP